MGWGINTGSVIKMLEQSLAQRQQRGTGMSNDPPGVYQPPPGGYPDGAVPWNARLPNALPKGGAGRPVPRMTLTPLQQAAADLMKQRTGVKSTPFRGDWFYNLTPKQRQQISRFNDQHPITGSTPTPGPDGRGYGLTYHSSDGTSLTVNGLRVARSYNS